MQRARAVAVVGAGAAGLVAARELLHEGHAVTVFERSDHVGGTWAYDPRPDGPDPVASSNGVHGGSSMYASLRTNLPRELMGFSSHESLAGRVFAGDPRAFPSHGEVLAFLRAFAEESGVARHVRLRADVVRVAPPVGRPGEEEERWSVAWRGESGEVAVEVFDAVVVCNGHCTVPLVPKLRGIGKWRGKQMHSHNYRIPEPFRDQMVVVVGLGASGIDIAREISQVAKEVHIASRGNEHRLGKIDLYLNVDCIQDDGQVRFAQGAAVTADTILYCTGYRYHFPFLDLDDLSVDEDNRVGPLYKHVFPPKYAPNLSFVGLPVKAIPFQSFESCTRGPSSASGLWTGDTGTAGKEGVAERGDSTWVWAFRAYPTDRSVLRCEQGNFALTTCTCKFSSPIGNEVDKYNSFWSICPAGRLATTPPVSSYPTYPAPPPHQTLSLRRTSTPVASWTSSSDATSVVVT